MPAYHSEFNDPSLSGSYKCIAGIHLLPIKLSKTNTVKGSAPILTSSLLGTNCEYLESMDDIIDEGLLLFRANCLFKSFEFKAIGDKLLVYIILAISEALSKIKPGSSRLEAQKLLNTWALQVSLPGESSFGPLNSLYPAPTNKNDSEFLKSYLAQLRQELVIRFLDLLYPATASADSGPSKWWTCFQKRKFMNKSFSTN